MPVVHLRFSGWPIIVGWALQHGSDFSDLCFRSSPKNRKRTNLLFSTMKMSVMMLIVSVSSVNVNAA